MKKFKIGDVVTIKSGGPKLTVIGTGSGFTSEVEVVWFAYNELYSRTMPEEALEAA